jgi:hypothetical protein
MLETIEYYAARALVMWAMLGLIALVNHYRPAKPEPKPKHTDSPLGRFIGRCIARLLIAIFGEERFCQWTAPKPPKPEPEPSTRGDDGHEGFIVGCFGFLFFAGLFVGLIYCVVRLVKYFWYL